MMISKKRLVTLILVAAAGSTACSPLGSSCLLCPSAGPVAIRGDVLDDSLYLPPGSSARITVEGVRVEVVEGVEKGRFVISGPLGQFDLGTLTPPARISASKDGWKSGEWTFFNSYTSSPFFSLSHAPHCLWGLVAFPAPVPQQPPAAGVRVEIIEGPDAGKVTFTNDAGLYRFDDLSTQPTFRVSFSKTGYRTDLAAVPALGRNHQLPWRLTVQ
jgi:hypothetical protein